MTNLLDVQWIHGSPDCATNADPPLQVHALDDETYILRENKCVNVEGPFLYLLFGAEKALLLDTGRSAGTKPAPAASNSRSRYRISLAD